METSGRSPAATASELEGGRLLLRHALATLAYRAAKVLRDTPETFANFRVGSESRTPLEILSHLGDLLDWAAGIVRGEQMWNDAAPRPWGLEVERFFTGLMRLDEALASAQPGLAPERLFQGPVADALTHIGQLAMLRRLAGSPVRGENYFQADIVAGRLGPEQSAPRREFE